VEQFSFEHAIQDTVPTVFSIGRHTDIVYIQYSGNVLKGTRYTWCHPKIRPWGQQLPTQCSKCGRIRSWSFSRQRSDVVVTCDACRHHLTFEHPGGELNWLGGEFFGGRWLIRDIPFTA
jgi:hypothetical protein